LLEIAPFGNLRPRQITCLDQTVRQLARMCTFGEVRDQSMDFCIDFAKPQPPARLLPGLPAKKSMRFFSVAPAVEQLQALLAKWQGAPELPDWAAQSGCSSAEYGDLLGKLLQHWGAQPPSRQARRERTGGTIRIVYSHVQVRRLIAASEFARQGGQLEYDGRLSATDSEFSRRGGPPEDDDTIGAMANSAAGAGKPAGIEAQAPRTPMEILDELEAKGDQAFMMNWEVADQSESGLGAIATKFSSAIGVGTLIGYRNLDEIEWRIGVVRRLGGTPEHKFSLGIQCLKGMPIVARLRAASASAGGVGHDDAILIQGETDSILIPRNKFKADLDCIAGMLGEMRPLRMLALIDRGNDFDHVGVKLLPTAA